MSQTNGKAKDPVCGMIIDVVSAVETQQWQGSVIHFCGASCAAKFKADPRKYIAPAASQHRDCCG